MTSILLYQFRFLCQFDFWRSDLMTNLIIFLWHCHLLCVNISYMKMDLGQNKSFSNRIYWMLQTSLFAHWKRWGHGIWTHGIWTWNLNMEFKHGMWTLHLLCENYGAWTPVSSNHSKYQQKGCLSRESIYNQPSLLHPWSPFRSSY